jgi:RNA polymerase sigma-70 factor (ECF subfamily)
MKLIEGQAEKVKQPKAWLFTVGRNMAINVMKKNKKMGREDELSSISREPDALTVLLEEEKYDRLWKAFAHLDTEEKEIYRLYLEHGFSHKEIAKIIEKSEGATKVMMHRTREKLRNYLNKEFENGIGHQSSNGE